MLKDHNIQGRLTYTHILKWRSHVKGEMCVYTMSDITDLDISGIDIDTSNLAPKEHTHTSADISDKVNECIYEEKASFEVLGVEDNVIWIEPEAVVTGVWVGQYMVCINDSLSFTVHYTRESFKYTRDTYHDTNNTYMIGDIELQPGWSTASTP